VPVSALKGNEPSSPNTGDWFAACSAPLGEEFSKAVSAVGFVIPGSESLASQRLLAMGAGEALPMPGVVAISNSALCNHLTALDAFGGKFFFITFSTVDVLLLGNE